MVKTQTLKPLHAEPLKGFQVWSLDLAQITSRVYSNSEIRPLAEFRIKQFQMAQWQRSLLLRLAAPITSWDTLSEIARDSVAKKRLSDPEMTNLMDRFEERRVQWVAASNTIEARQFL